MAHNFKIYNSDLCAKKIINNDKSVIDSIKSNFGNESYINGKFNTKLISKIVFENELELVGNPMEEEIYFDDDRSWYFEMEDFYKFIKVQK